MTDLIVGGFAFVMGLIIGSAFGYLKAHIRSRELQEKES